MDHSWGYATDPRLRDENQDCHGVFEFPDFTLAVVCDGMGGHVGGAHASAIAVRTIHDTLREMEVNDIPAALEEALTRANQAIYEAARKNHRLMGMGTTVVAAAITDDKAYLAHVGDSRAYLLRQGQVEQITRDHTMVNLFVDAELLTPEDAATHPEAHVLSRSLGVERTVDVELTEPVDLAADDVVFLCSDGVHGVITDWELGNVDWGAPHGGIQHVMDIVAAREGDDNATAVAVLLATSFEDVPPTAVPDPDRIGDQPNVAFSAKGVTAVPLDETESGRTIVPDGLGDHDDQAPPPLSAPRASISQPAPLPPPPGGNRAGYIVYEESEPPSAGAVPDVRKRQKAADSAAQQGGNRQRTLLLATLGVLAIGGVGLIGAVVVGVSMSSGPKGPEPRPLEPEPSGEVAHIETQQAVEDPVPLQPVDAEDPFVFRPVVPDAPRRLPHRALEYTQPPPGGPAQWEAVQAARNRNCADSTEAVIRGMKASIDHATLYSQSWFCFNEVHQRPLMDAQAATWEEFQRLLVHFEGPPEKRADLPDDIKRLPEWYQPAMDGIEYRLESWERSTDKDRFALVMADLLGEPTVTDQLARDVILIAQAARGLSRVEDPNDRVVSWWARRVYAATTAMNGPVGRLIEANRPEVVPLIDALIADATTPRLSDPDDPSSSKIPVPDMVTTAYETATGALEAPTAQKAAPTGPTKPIEPDLDDIDIDPAKVHRGTELVIESPK